MAELRRPGNCFIETDIEEAASRRRVLESLENNLVLVVLAAGFVHIGWLAGCLATRRYRLAASSILTASTLGLVLALSVGIRWAAGLSLVPWIDQLVVPATLALWVAMRFGCERLLSAGARPAAWPLYAAGHLLLLAVAGWHFQSATAPRADILEPQAEIQYPMVAVDDAVLVTDQGRIFSLFHFDPREAAYDDKLLATFIDAQPSQAENQEAPRRNARTASLAKISRTKVGQPDGITNCHGWVFTGGRYALSDAAAEALLQDNGYQRVSQPRTGDVVVYRDDAGQIVHTGRVRRVHSGEEVWIESKWGTGSRYLHLPLDQCYSTTLEYYRARRPGHIAQIVQTPNPSPSRFLSLRRGAPSGRARTG